MIEFIFMLTRNDQTVSDAHEVYETLRDTGLRYVGFKDIGLPPPSCATSPTQMRADGREVFLEVVSERAEDELRSVEAALDIGVDWLMGGTHADEALAILDRVGPPGTPGRPKYCPFPGRVVDHPSILEGTIDEIAQSAHDLTARDGRRWARSPGLSLAGRCPALVRCGRRPASPARSSPPAASTQPNGSTPWRRPARGRSRSAAPSSIADCPPATPSANRSSALLRWRPRPPEGRWSPTVPDAT